MDLFHKRLATLVGVLLLSSLSGTASAQDPSEQWPVPPGPPPWSSGYHNGSFYVRSPDDVFRLYVQGRVHVDFYDAFGPGLDQLGPGQAVAQGFILRRARLEMAGEFFQQWQWQLGAEFAPSTDDNVAATTESLACKVTKTGTQSCAPQENPVDAPSVKPAPTDAFVNYAAAPWANVQVGQFYLPFTLENRISDNTTAFLERSLVVRTIGVPLQRDIGAMAWGESTDRRVYFAAGVFNGDGPNRPNVDGRFDLAARVFVRPFAGASTGGLRWAQIGGSFHAGSRDPSRVGYDMPSLTTQQGFTFWKPTYVDGQGRLVHVLPSDTQESFAVDLYLPVDGFDFTAEGVYADLRTREAIDGYQLSPYTERFGALSGWGAYVQAGYWIIGDRDILGPPSYGRPIHVDFSAAERRARHGLEVVARLDLLRLRYDAASRGGSSDPKTPNGDVDVTAGTLGINYWATRHLRVSANYGLYSLPTHAPLGTLHEVSARVGVQF